MKINKEVIQKLNPCSGRFNNYLKYYSDFDGDLKEFILLENISYSDKVWVATRLFTKEQNVKLALLCASSVLSIFENKYPNDLRPRQALEAVARFLVTGDINARAAWAAARAAARAASDAARAAARAAARDAAWAAARDASEEQQQVNLLFLVEAEKV